jgi:PhnB protein
VYRGQFLMNILSVMPMNKDETQIRSLLNEFTGAIHAKDAARAIALCAEDSVTFDLAPPLEQGPDATHNPALLEEWFKTWKGPISSVSRDLKVDVGNDVAYAYGLQHMTGTKIDGEEADLWFRATACFRRDNGQWRITHMHNSVPFAMDGSEKALLDLTP